MCRVPRRHKNKKNADCDRVHEGIFFVHAVHAYRLVPSVYVFFILAGSDSSAVALNSPSKNKKHIHIL